MNFNEITKADLQPKHSKGESADTRIRRSWTLQMPEEVKSKFSHFPGDVKRQLYKSFDLEVNEIWTSMLAKSNAEAQQQGAKTIRVDGESRFEDKFCKDPDDLLIQAAQVFITRLATRPIK